MAVAAAPVAMCLLLTACSGGGSDEETSSAPRHGHQNVSISPQPHDPSALPKPSVTAKVGKQVMSTDQSFTTRIPAGWEPSTEESKGKFNPNILAATSTTPHEGFAATLEVMKVPLQGNGGVTAAPTPKNSKKRYKLPKRLADGSPATGYSGVQTINDKPVRTYEYLISHKKSLYVVTVESSAGVDAQRVLDVTLQNWKWAK